MGSPTPDAARPLEAILPDGWPRPRGYTNGVRVPAGRDLLFVAGQIGWDRDRRLVSDDFVAQFGQALANCVAVVEAAGGATADIVRLTMFATDRDAYLGCLPELGEAYRRVMGDHYPVMSLVVVEALVEAGAQIEIEATAALPPRDAGAC